MKHTPRRRFGQNFLHDPAIIAQLAAAIAPRPADFFLEIGPGEGALTLPLLDAGAAVHAVEIDRDLAARWAARGTEYPRLQVTCADALKTDLGTLIPDGIKARLAGNLPYNISTPLLFRFVPLAARLRDLHLMLQREVVDRMCAPPGNKTYGRLTVMLAPHFRCERLLRVAAGAFRPAPRVESAFVRLTPHDSAPFAIDSTRIYAMVVAAAFSMRRKMLRTSVRAWLDDDDLAALDIDPRRRPETLAPGDYAQLANAIAARHPDLR